MRVASIPVAKGLLQNAQNCTLSVDFLKAGSDVCIVVHTVDVLVVLIISNNSHWVKSVAGGLICQLRRSSPIRHYDTCRSVLISALPGTHQF